MSNFLAMAKLRGENEMQPAEFIDNYLGRHRYGVRFFAKVDGTWTPSGRFFWEGNVDYDPLARIPDEVLRDYFSHTEGKTEKHNSPKRSKKMSKVSKFEIDGVKFIKGNTITDDIRLTNEERLEVLAKLGGVDKSEGQVKSGDRLLTPDSTPLGGRLWLPRVGETYYSSFGGGDYMVGAMERENCPHLFVNYVTSEDLRGL
jgi:hypothetical protein